MRPVNENYKMHFGFGEAYPPELAHLTIDGKHHGFDYLTPTGTEVFASVDGVINFVGWKRGYGKCIYIKFWTGKIFKKTYRLILAHLSAIEPTLKVGQKIKKTKQVACSGDSGMATNHPHLHLQCEQLIDGQWIPVNPHFVTGD